MVDPAQAAEQTPPEQPGTQASPSGSAQPKDVPGAQQEGFVLQSQAQDEAIVRTVMAKSSPQCPRGQ